MGKKFTIALDVDDVLFPCLEPACKAVGIDYKKIVDWDLTKCELTDAERSALMYTMSRDDFLSQQKPYKGSVEMVDKLVKDGHNIIIASAVEPGAMTIRGMMLMQAMPMFNPKNIMLGARKELLNVDIILDDSPYNMGGNAKYSVLYSTQYNQNESGYLRIKNYDEFLDLVGKLADMPDDFAHVGRVGKPGIVCLVGPSGSGKSFICDELEKNPLFKKIRALTDRAPREGEKNGVEYNFVTPEKFQTAVDQKKLLESTQYAGHNYGIAYKEIEGIWKDGRIGIKPVDIDGARAIKAAYPDRTLTIFIRRDKDELIKAIIERNCSTEDKVARIMSIDLEYANEHLCDFTVFNNGSLDHAVGQILRMM